MIMIQDCGLYLLFLLVLITELNNKEVMSMMLDSEEYIPGVSKKSMV